MNIMAVRWRCWSWEGAGKSMEWAQWGMALIKTTGCAILLKGEEESLGMEALEQFVRIQQLDGAHSKMLKCCDMNMISDSAQVLTMKIVFDASDCIILPHLNSPNIGAFTRVCHLSLQLLIFLQGTPCTDIRQVLLLLFSRAAYIVRYTSLTSLAICSYGRRVVQHSSRLYAA